MHACMHAHKCAHSQPHILCIHTHTITCTHVAVSRAQTHDGMKSYMHTGIHHCHECSHVLTYTRGCILACMHSRTHAFSRSRIHAHILLTHAHTCVHLRTHARTVSTHTYALIIWSFPLPKCIYIYIYIYVYRSLSLYIYIYIWTYDISTYKHSDKRISKQISKQTNKQTNNQSSKHIHNFVIISIIISMI